MRDIDPAPAADAKRVGRKIRGRVSVDRPVEPALVFALAVLERPPDHEPGSPTLAYTADAPWKPTVPPVACSPTSVKPAGTSRELAGPPHRQRSSELDDGRPVSTVSTISHAPLSADTTLRRTLLMSSGAGLVTLRFAADMDRVSHHPCVG